MKPQERIKRALEHKPTDKLPVNYGTSATGMHASIIYRLRKHYGLDSDKAPIKIIDAYQLLGEIKDDLKVIIGSDVSVVETSGTVFGFNYDKWKEWELMDGTPVLVPGNFNIEYSLDAATWVAGTTDLDLDAVGTTAVLDTIGQAEKTNEQIYHTYMFIRFKLVPGATVGNGLVLTWSAAFIKPAGLERVQVDLVKDTPTP